MAEWWVRGTFFTCWVETDRDWIITDTALILHRFRGQPFKNLLNWTPVQEVQRIKDQ